MQNEPSCSQPLPQAPRVQYSDILGRPQARIGTIVNIANYVSAYCITVTSSHWPMVFLPPRVLLPCNGRHNHQIHLSSSSSLGSDTATRLPGSPFNQSGGPVIAIDYKTLATVASVLLHRAYLAGKREMVFARRRREWLPRCLVSLLAMPADSQNNTDPRAASQ